MGKREKLTSLSNLIWSFKKLKQINEELHISRGLETILSKGWSKSEKITPDKIS